MNLKKTIAATILAGTLALDLAPAFASPQVARVEPAVWNGSQVQYVNVVQHRRRYRRTVVVRRRSKRKSAAIVGGSAAGGALIGALAGGGKGAAIGAVAGGGAGLAYDRATHKKVVRER